MPTTGADQRDLRGSIRRVLLVTPECAPFAKVGGMADAVAGLAKALCQLGIDARVIMPLYRRVDRAGCGVAPDGTACVHLGCGAEHWIGVHAAKLDGAVPVWLVDFGRYFDRDGVYGEGHAGEYGDNAQRFALLCKAALQLCQDRAWIPDVMHLHDWPAALTAAFLRSEPAGSPLSRCASLLTIHNIGYQGKHPADAYDTFGIGGEHFEVFEDHRRINLLKGGIRFADGITTVSPSHLEEIVTPEGSHGLAPFLTGRREDLTGILNGADHEHWSPERDRFLPARFSAEDLSGKQRCKRALQERMGLPRRAELPLFGLVTRLATQKGIDLLRGALPPALYRLPMQLCMLGAGEPVYEDFFRWLHDRFPDEAGCTIGHDEALGHCVVAGADFFLVPSLYEPCGLGAIYALRYGTLPVVRATGGLRDTVERYDGDASIGTGFVFQDATAEALHGTLETVVSTWFQHLDHVEAMRRRAMARDFSWARSAPRYADAYERAVARRGLWR